MKLWMQLLLIVFVSVLSGCAAEEEAIPADPNAPILNSIGNQSVIANSSVQFTVAATDPNGDGMTFSSSSAGGVDVYSVLNNAATFNPSTQTFFWTPTQSEAGIYSVTFTVTDDSADQHSDSETITLAVLSVVAYGKTLYDDECGRCHGYGALSEKKAAIDVDITDAIRDNVGGMGNISLTAEQVSAIVAYLTTLTQ